MKTKFQRRDERAWQMARDIYGDGCYVEIGSTFDDQSHYQIGTTLGTHSGLPTKHHYPGRYIVLSDDGVIANRVCV